MGWIIRLIVAISSSVCDISAFKIVLGLDLYFHEEFSLNLDI